MSQALYRKYRPAGWQQVIGQEHIVQTLKNAISGNHIVHAYLFSGPRGTGKTSTARLLAKAVNCLSDEQTEKPCNTCLNCIAVNENRFLDLIEIDAASNTSVDDVRDLRDKINFSPNQGRYKVYIIDEVHMLSTAAFNALLKTLEEPPSHAIFILATTEVHKIPATVLSRCQRYEFRKISIKEINELLNQIAKSENFETEPEALIQIARQSTGALRDAISLLDQLASTGEKITLAYTQSVLGTATNQLVLELIDTVLNNQANIGIQIIYKALDGGSDPRQFAKQIVEYLRNLLLIKLDSKSITEITEDLLESVDRQSKQFDTTILTNAINAFNKAASEIRTGWQPNLPLELALIETIGAIHPSVPQKNNVVTQPPEPVPTVKSQPMQSKIENNSPRKSVEPADEIKTIDNKPPATDTAAEKDINTSDSSEENGTSLQQITETWENIRAELKKIKRPAEALLNSCRLLSLKKDVLTLGFASDIVKSKMEEKDNLELTQKVISKFIGHNIVINCVIFNKNSNQDTSVDDLPADSMVKTAIDLGGRIIHKDN